MNEWRVEKLVPGGEGLCRLEGGEIGFVRDVAPGDLIRVETVVRRKGYQRAERWALLEAGPKRVDPACPVQSRCGGCDWMHLDLAAQREAKIGLLREALVRTGGFQVASLPEIGLISAGADTGYRTRAQLQVDAAGRLGFFSAGTHELIAVADCMVCDPELRELLDDLQGAAKLGLLRGCSRLELRVADFEPVRVVRVSVPKRRRGKAPRGLGKLESLLNARGTAVVLEGSAADDALVQRWKLGDALFLEAPPSAFTQVNQAVNRRLVSAVVEGARARGVTRFLDLYCGAGNFSLPLAAAGMSGVGVEVSKGAVRAAQDATARMQLQRPGAIDLEFRVGDAEQVLARLSERRFDLMVLDPPRAGAKGSIRFVLESESQWLCMCSCDPVTLARDLRVLIQGGFVLEEITAYDMFPHTHHVEALAWLRRAAR